MEATYGTTKTEADVLRAAWYEQRGPAQAVLIVGELPDPEPGPGEVRIALSVSGLSPGDVKKRAVFGGSSEMRFPRVIPHSDGAGVIDRVGVGVDEARLGRPAWCYGAQSYRPYGTAAEYVVVPEELAVDLSAAPGAPSRDTAEQAACLGIAGITGHRAIFADGSVAGRTVLVYGATGGVGSIAAQLARRDGATVLAVVRPADAARASGLGVAHVLTTDETDLAQAIRALAPDGVDRIAEVDFADHIAIDAEVIAVGGVISSYFSSQDTPTIPYWTLGFADTTLRLLGSDDFPAPVKRHAAEDLTAAVLDGSVRSTIAARVPLAEIARAHELVEGGTRGRVLVEIS